MATRSIDQLNVADIPTSKVPSQQYWFALYTRARHEKSVAKSLQQRGLNVFLPLLTQIHRWSDRQKKVQVPLFPGYTFVRSIDVPESFVRILNTPGVVGFVGAGRRGIQIPEKQIDDIQKVMTQALACTLHPFLRVGQRVRVRGGCLNGIEGILLAISGNKSLVISVESISRSIAISVDGYDIEILSSNGLVC